ncbi:MAG TPA: hypothetical protein DEQ14_05695 [Treponema sp.]|nr:hypothetical protein [Treponema sp.]
MKKFFLKFLLLFALISVSVGIPNFLYINTNYWKDNTVNDTLKFKNVPLHIQLANVGSSHGVRSFDYSRTAYQCFNFGISGQLFLYDYAVLKQYINHFDKNAVLLIPISYFQITRMRQDFKEIKARYYRFLANELIDNYSIFEKILFNNIPVLTAGSTLRFIIKDTSPIPEFQVMTETELIEYSVKKYEAWTTNNQHEYEAGEEGFLYNKRMASLLIDFCYANNIQPVLVTTPVTSVLNSIYTEKHPSFFDTFYRFTRELREAYPALLYLDYSHNPCFENDFSLFRDGDHLNTVGAEKFTALVIDDLRANGIIIPDSRK